MYLVCILVISLVLLFAFSMSREKGKNTKFARKDANPIAQKKGKDRSFDTSQGIEIN